MDKIKTKKKAPAPKGMLSEINYSLYCLAAYFSGFANALRDATPKQGVQ